MSQAILFGMLATCNSNLANLNSPSSMGPSLCFIHYICGLQLLLNPSRVDLEIHRVQRSLRLGLSELGKHILHSNHTNDKRKLL
uniref:Uncharacterized protein n=1 Tax=Picea glauca TaxID=3330 RepID=A0A101M2S9_PICGL|nr:hypothetical protein ABT39_MTgene3203 [Picea glauca]QHR88475.1 hypothetical protein Q903MT_gene2489 [Picea sitchensis]